MNILMVLLFARVALSASSQNVQSVDEKNEKGSGNHNLRKLHELLLDKLQTTSSDLKSDNRIKKMKDLGDVKSLTRKSKSLAYYPYFPSQFVPFGVPPGYFYPKNKEVVDNGYPNEWLSRTEPYRKNPSPLDSPTYYIRLPPNPYAFVPGLGYVSRPPSLSDPEVLENIKPEPSNQVGNDILHDPFYRLPINFLSNGKPTSVYQLSSGAAVPKPESAVINLNKGPYVFNGKPNEIFLVAQIYDALYGDELLHFYP